MAEVVLDLTEEQLTGEESPHVDADVQIHSETMENFYQSMKEFALGHVEDIKARLLNEKTQQLNTQEAFYLDKLHNLSLALETMTSKFEQSEAERAQEQEAGYAQLDNFSTLYETKYKIFISPYSVKEIFGTWKLVVLKRRRYQVLFANTLAMLNKRKVTKIFHKMHKASMLSHFERKEKENNAQVGSLAKQTIEAYEGELHKLRVEVQEAHAVARHEQMRRHQLEEDLRRMFLKNMTMMNMEALSLFNFPPEYKSDGAAPPRISSQVKKDLLTFVQGEGDASPAPRTAAPVPSAAPGGDK